MKVLQNYIKATNTHNFEEVRKSLHPNAVYFFSDQTCTTHEEIQAYFENGWSIVQEESYQAKNVNWLYSGSDSATCTYTYFYEGYIDGKTISGRGRATNIFVKESDEWLLIHEHLSPLPK
ncbi:YybH family protein [Bacillus mesophilum]|uniref:Nuclear transport factor 2 family protein n=1 Tax=Bacillus mesophilum TaxID=1071718 RepID=A0A7V7RNB0_9BACI|nr:nuclear transport factor 2 family protein [Bacillus mesophilum]KAB2333987.1 nuclear transport factor 2 family protein [Bacillus mesophilum]